MRTDGITHVVDYHEPAWLEEAGHEVEVENDALEPVVAVDERESNRRALGKQPRRAS